MDAITLGPEIETWLSSLAPVMPVPNADTNVGWKTEAERLAQGASRREREPRQ
jgi:hypothetical protein